MNKKVRTILLSLIVIFILLIGRDIPVFAQPITNKINNNSKIDSNNNSQTNENNIQSLLEQLKDKNNNIVTNANLNKELGLAYYNEKNVNEALNYFILSQKQYEKVDDFIQSNEVIQYIITIYTKQEQYEKIIQYSLEFLNNTNLLYKQTSDSKYLKDSIGVYYLIATTCNIVGDYAYGKEYFEIGESIEEKYKIKNSSNLDYVKSNYYYYQANYNESEKYAYNGIIIDKENKSQQSYLEGIILLARVQIKKNETANALQNLNIIKANLNNLKDQVIKAQYYYYLAIMQEANGEYDKAIENYQEAYNYISKNNIYIVNLGLLKGIGNCYSKLGNYRDANTYYEKYINIQQQLVIAKENINNSIVKNNNINNPINVENQIKIKRSQYYNNLLTASIIAVIVLLLVIVYAYLKKKAKINRLKGELNRDILTKAYTRRYIMNYMEELIVGYESFFVAILDIDNYKAINDNYGHLFGDIVLKRIVNTLKLITSNKVKVCRFGGEEFLIVIKSEDDESVKKIIEMMRFSIESLEWDNNKEVTASIGVTKFIRFENLKETIKRADELLYKAKRNGKNRVEW
ncbi:MAG: tetratricopeptide repeat-containing diguanylate cyclase [Sarcina sp.]